MIGVHLSHEDVDTLIEAARRHERKRLAALADDKALIETWAKTLLIHHGNIDALNDLQVDLRRALREGTR